MYSENEEFIPYAKQNISDQDIKAVEKVLISDFLTQGPEVEAFEADIVKFTQAKFATAVNSATSALHLACLALQIKRKDIVWTSPITFVASSNCALYCDADVDFVDVEVNTGRICINKLKIKLEEAEKNNKLPKLLIVVHLAGTSCEMESIKALAIKYNFFIIEDASHAIGGEYKGSKVGSCEYSDISVFSFHPVKIITTGEGGMITTNDKRVDALLKNLRSHGIERSKDKFIKKPFSPWQYQQHNLGFNYRMNDIEAALGRSQLKRIANFVSERNKIYEIYMDVLNDLPVSLNPIPKDVYSSLHLAILYIKNNCDKNQYKILFEAMKNQNIGVQLHYYPVHLHPYYQNLGFRDIKFENAEIYSHRNISIPIYPGLSFDQIKRVSLALRNSLNSAGLL